MALLTRLAAALVEYKGPGTSSVLRLLHTKLFDFPSLLDYGGDPTGVADSSPAFQRCHDILGPMGITEVRVPAGKYLLGSQVNLSAYPMRFIGMKPQYSRGGPGKGSWLIIKSAAFNPFAISTTSALSGGFFHFGVYQEQPTPGAGWAPVAYPDVWRCDGVGGEYFLDGIYAAPVYNLAYSFNSGRLNVTRFRGQVLNRGVYIDQAYDCNRFDNWHVWPYWSTASEVQIFVQANMDLFVLGRCDTPIIDKIFNYCARSTIRTIETASGHCTQAQIGTVASDAVKTALWVQSNNFVCAIGTMNSQGEVVPAGSGIPVVGGSCIDVEGRDCRISVGQFHAERYRKSAIFFRAAATGCSVQIGTSDFWLMNYDLGSDLVKDFSGSSSVQFATPPFIDSCNGATVGANAASSVLQNGIAGAVNEVRAFASGAGAPVRIEPVGADPSTVMVVGGKGGTNLAVGGVTVLRTDIGTTGANSGLLVRSQPTAVELYVESTVSTGDVIVIPKGYSSFGIKSGGYMIGKFEMSVGANSGTRLVSGIGGVDVILDSSAADATFSLYAKGTGGVKLYSGSNLVFRTDWVSGGVCGLLARSQATEVAMIVESPSANADLSLVPKSSGRVKFGTVGATADVPITGYIDIKDSSGTARRLAVIA